MRRAVSLMTLVLASASACEKDKPGQAPTEDKTAPAVAPAQVAGVYPEDWKCESVVTTETLAQILGGTVHVTDAAAIPPRGVPHPCNYLVEAPQPEAWTFDVDCRDNMKQRADALFAQYAKDSADQVAQYKGMADAGTLKAMQATDGGPPPKAPEGAAEVAVGAKGLDHHGQGLIFIDDDAPCYVRVVGPDPSKRLELAKLLAKQLTFANAPMTPRRFQ